MEKVKVITSMYGTIESDIATLNILSLYIGEGADALNNNGSVALAKDAQRLSSEIHAKLKSIGAYDDL